MKVKSISLVIPCYNEEQTLSVFYRQVAAIADALSERKFEFIEKVHPGRERYWKKILNEEHRLRNLYRRLERVDRLIKKFRMLEKFAWNMAILAVK